MDLCFFPSSLIALAVFFFQGIVACDYSTRCPFENFHKKYGWWNRLLRYMGEFPILRHPDIYLSKLLLFLNLNYFSALFGIVTHFHFYISYTMFPVFDYYWNTSLIISCFFGRIGLYDASFVRCFLSLFWRIRGTHGMKLTTKPAFGEYLSGWCHSDQHMSKRWQVFIVNDEQMSNWVGVNLPVAIFSNHLKQITSTDFTNLLFST